MQITRRIAIDIITIPWSEWTLVRAIGRGGFGTVYEIGRKDQNGREEKEVLKVINIPHEAEVINQFRMNGYDDASISARLKEDAQKTNQEYYLQNQLKGHPNIVRVDDNMVTAHSDGLGWDLFIRMELLRPMMEVLMTKQDLSEKEIIKIGTDICEALNVCHRKDIIHRDIKPDNIFLGEAGDWKLGDFGIARTMEHTTKATKAGTYNYLAPEVYHGEKYGKQVDIYSLGMVLYWLLNKRRRPFLPVDRPPTASEDEQARIKRFRGDPLPAPVRGSEELKRIVLRACAYHPKDRYSSPEEMYKDLQAVESGAHHVNASAAAGKDTYDSFAVLESTYEGSGISAGYGNGSDVSIGSRSAAGEGVSMGNGWEKDDPGSIGSPHWLVGGRNKNDFLGNMDKTEPSVEINDKEIKKDGKASSESKPISNKSCPIGRLLAGEGILIGLPLFVCYLTLGFNGPVDLQFDIPFVVSSIFMWGGPLLTIIFWKTDGTFLSLCKFLIFINIYFAFLAIVIIVLIYFYKSSDWGIIGGISIFGALIIGLFVSKFLGYWMLDGEMT